MNAASSSADDENTWADLNEAELKEIRDAANAAAAAAVRRFVRGFADEDEIAQDVLIALVRKRRRVKGLEQQLELADTPEQQLELADTLKQQRIGSLEAFANTVARNAVRMNLRADGRRESYEEFASRTRASDDNVARLLDQMASATSITKAIRYGLELGDQVGVRVITAWLDLAAEAGATPSRKDVAEEAKVSLPTVDASLRRFRTYLTSQ